MPIGYLIRRIGQFFLVLWGAASINFLLPRLAPGNPVRERLISQATAGGPMQAGIEEMVRAYNIEFGLDKPLWVQYARYMWHLMQFDLGYSIVNYPAKVLPLMGLDDRPPGGLLAVRLRARHAARGLDGLAPLPALRQLPQRADAGAVGDPLLHARADPPIYLLAVLVPIFPFFGGYSMGTVPRFSLPFIIDVIDIAILPQASRSRSPRSASGR